VIERIKVQTGMNIWISATSSCNRTAARRYAAEASAIPTTNGRFIEADRTVRQMHWNTGIQIASNSSKVAPKLRIQEMVDSQGD
ncbi:MAG: hypothetical protein ABIH23_25480, partial [bacterium]